MLELLVPACSGLLVDRAVYEAELAITFEFPRRAELFLACGDVDIGRYVLVCEFLAGGDVSCCAEEADVADEGADRVGEAGVVEV